MIVLINVLVQSYTITNFELLEAMVLISQIYHQYLIVHYLATIAQMVTFCPAGRFLGHRAHRWVRPLMPFPQAACIVTSSTLTARHQGWNLELSYSLLYLHLATEVYMGCHQQ